MTDERKPPEWLDEDAREHWHEMQAALADEGIELNPIALALLSRTWADLMQVWRRVDETGGLVITNAAGDLVVNPWLQVANQASQRYWQIITDCGLTPAGRAALR